MALQGIGTGSSPNDGTGDSLIVGAKKVNDNFQEIYDALGDGTSLLTGDPDIDVGFITATGASFSGGVSIAGTLTYEDVENIDSVGVVTARTGVRITDGGLTVTAGVSTFSADVNIETDLDVTVHAGLGSLSVAGVSTFTGNIDANGTLDVDGDTFLDKVTVSENAFFSANIDVEGTSELDDVNVSGVTTFASNVSIADSIIHTGDTDTSIRFPAADTFAVETAGSERFRIDSTGNTLIYGVLRKDNVNSSLSISGGNGADSSANIVLHGSGGSPANVTQFRTGSTERVRIGSTGNIGINSTDPSYLVDIASGSASVRLNSTSTSTLVITSGASNAARIEFGDLANNDTGYIYYDNTDDSMQFATNGSTERLRLTADGEVQLRSKGIDFSQIQTNVSGMTSEILNHYEEGTWTPTATAYGGTMTVTTATFIRVGNLCHIQAYLQFDGTADADDIIIGGLPFTAFGTSSNYYIMAAQTDANLTNFMMRAQGGTTNLTAVHLLSGDGDAKPEYNDVVNKFIMVNGSYRTA